MFSERFVSTQQLKNMNSQDRKSDLDIDQKWTDYDEMMLEKSIVELEKWKFTEHERVIKKIKKQYSK